MRHLSLAFLGSPQARLEGRVLTFSTRKTLALLIYLATEGGLHTRETITTLFWPDSDPRRARATMRRTLSYLRDGLGGEQHLTIEGDTLGFNSKSDFDLDLNILHAAWNLARVAPPPTAAQDDPHPPMRVQLQDAIALYRGDFLAGFSLTDAPEFDDWVSLQREVWHRKLDVVFDRLSQVQSEGGDIENALETTSRWVAHHALNEAAHRRLMQLHFAAGDRAAALQAYTTCQTILAKELDARPAPETEALAERIRHTTPPHRARRPAGETLTSTWLPGDAPLIGRETEYSHLVAAYYTARRGRIQVVTLEGEAGIGKTRLATDFLSWAASHGADLIQGKAFQSGGRLPYQPLAQALRSRLAQENAPDDLLTDVWLVELSRLLPELRDRYPDLTLLAAIEGEAARLRLFEAVARLGQALAERAPLIIFVDDMQWADTASLDLLHYVGGQWAESGSPVLLLLCLRAEDLAANSSLTHWLAGLGRDLPLTRLTLKPLTAEDTLKLVHYLSTGQNWPSATPHPSPNLDQFTRWLFTETGGQPFYMMETLKVMVERDLLKLRLNEAGLWTIDVGTALAETAALSGLNIIPPGIREVLRSRLERLSPLTVELLVAGAVLGHRFTFEHLCQVGGLEENAGLPALEEALANHLLQEEPGEVSYSPGRPYVFTHDKIRDVVYTEASEARRRVFHRRALEVLQTITAPAAELAHHALAAGLPDAAFRFSLEAGDQALRLFEVKMAITHYEQARHQLSIINDQLPISNLQSPVTNLQSPISNLYLNLGRAYELSGNFEMARDVYQTMLAFARTLNEPNIICAALNRLATVTAQGLNDIETAAALLREALTIAEDAGDRAGLAETEWNLANMSVHSGDPETSLPHGKRALTLARELGQQELTARCLNVLAYAETISGQWPEGEVHADESRALYVALGNRELEADNLCLVAKARINCGRPQAGIAAARAAQQISLDIENRWGQANSAKYLALGLLECGQYGQALVAVQGGVATAQASGYAPLLAFNLAVLGCIYRAMLALEKALVVHLELLEINETLASRLFTKTAVSELSADYALAGEWEAAHTYAQQTLAARDNTLLHGGLNKWLEIEALLRAEDVALARQEVQRFGARFENNRRYRIPYLRSLAVLAEWDGSREQAIAHLQEALALAEEIGLPGEEWQILAKLGELYQESGNVDRAREVWSKATETIQSLAATIDDEDLRTAFLATTSV